MNHGRAGAFVGTLFGISLLIFFSFVTQVILDPKGVGLEEMTDLLKEDLLGNFILLIPGLFSIIFAIMLVSLWFSSQKWKDLRFKMAFYLYHSKVQKDQIIPLDHLARVGVSTIPEISTTLERMIAKDELKGIVDHDKGLYIHKGLTRRTMKILTALPPARVNQLDDIRQWALKGAEGYSIDDDVEELEPFEIEELPSATNSLNNRGSEAKVPCPDCGKMNRIKDHFCTYCGEVM